MLDSGIKKGGIPVAEFRESSLFQGFADFFHQRIVKIKIMHDGKPHCQHFVCLKEMAEICLGMAAAGWAIAFLVDRGIILLVFGVHNIPDAAPGVQMLSLIHI